MKLHALFESDILLDGSTDEYSDVFTQEPVFIDAVKRFFSESSDEE